MEKVSIVILTKNVDHIIGRCLEALKGVSDDIVILDGASTDGTVAICKKYHARVYTLYDPENKVSGAELKNRGIAKAKHDWILNIDADEIVSPQLKKEIEDIMRHGTSYTGFYIKRRDYAFLNTHIATTTHLRLYRRSKGSFKHTIHERVYLDGETTTLNGVMDHYSFKDVTDYFTRFNKYTTLEARALYTKNPHPSRISILLNAVLRPPVEFCIWYFGKGMWKRGLVAFFFAWLSGFYQFVKYLKYYERTVENKKSSSLRANKN